MLVKYKTLVAYSKHPPELKVEAFRVHRCRRRSRQLQVRSADRTMRHSHPIIHVRRRSSAVEFQPRTLSASESELTAVSRLILKLS